MLNSTQDEAYKHIEAADVDKVKNAVQTVLDWYDSTLQKQIALPQNIDPVVTVAEISSQLKVTRNYTRQKSSYSIKALTISMDILFFFTNFRIGNFGFYELNKLPGLTDFVNVLNWALERNPC